MNPSSRSEIIRDLSAKAGFHLCGMSPAETLDAEVAPYREWLDRMQWGNMDYLLKNFEKRLDPRKVMPEARTVIALLSGYESGIQIPSDDNYIIARYARGMDYHVRIKEMLAGVIRGMEEHFGKIMCRSFVDSGVLLEKAWAERCGLGWRGKNTLLINRGRGSWFFIGIILTDLETEYDPPETDHCGSCDRCLRACPTGALAGPHLLDPVKCIAYQTIENEQEIPEDLRGRFAGRIFGCDICQEVCPFNREPMVCDDPACTPSAGMVRMRRTDWEGLSPAAFEGLFLNTPIIRTGYELLMRNIRFVTGK